MGWEHSACYGHYIGGRGNVNEKCGAAQEARRRRSALTRGDGQDVFSHKSSLTSQRVRATLAVSETPSHRPVPSLPLASSVGGAQQLFHAVGAGTTFEC